MSKSWSTALKDSISEVFSTSFFLVPESYAEPIEVAHALAAKGWYEGFLDFVRQDEGVRIWVWSPERIAMELAANIFACDVGDLSPDQILDAYREMINMVSGNVLTSVDVDSAWRMGLPKAARIAQGTVGQVTARTQNQLIFEVEGQPVLAGWRAFRLKQ